MLVKKINLSWIIVSDMQKSKQFFTDLGLKISSGSDEYGWLELVGKDGGSMLGIGQCSDEQGDDKPGQNAVVTFTVDNLENAITELKSKGVKFVGDVIEVPGHVKMITFLDLDGNKFQLVQELN